MSITQYLESKCGMHSLLAQYAVEAGWWCQSQLLLLPSKWKYLSVHWQEWQDFAFVHTGIHLPWLQLTILRVMTQCVKNYYLRMCHTNRSEHFQHGIVSLPHVFCLCLDRTWSTASGPEAPFQHRLLNSRFGSEAYRYNDRNYHMKISGVTH